MYTQIWKVYIHINGKLRGILSSDLTEFSQHPRCAIFPISGLAEVFATSKLSFFFIFGLAAVVITPELSIFYIFGRARAKSCHFQNFLKQLRMLHNIFSYFGKRHSKLPSVKTKTIHFPPFFEFREFCNTQTIQVFPHILNSKSSHNTQIIHFPHFLHSESSHNTQTFIPYSISTLDFCEKMDCTYIYIYIHTYAYI